MRIKKYYKKVKYKIYGPYYQKIEDGRTTHISKDEYQSFYNMQQTSYKKKKSKQNFGKHTVEQGWPPSVKEILNALGYSVRGTKLSICLKRFFTIECALARYNYLTSEEQKKIGSPERLLEISKDAWRLHKHLNALREKNTFAGCMDELLKAKTQKNPV